VRLDRRRPWWMFHRWRTKPFEFVRRARQLNHGQCLLCVLRSVSALCYDTETDSRSCMSRVVSLYMLCGLLNFCSLTGYFFT
jgi:hypothetical protein